MFGKSLGIMLGQENHTTGLVTAFPTVRLTFESNAIRKPWLPLGHVCATLVSVFDILGVIHPTLALIPNPLFPRVEECR